MLEQTTTIQSRLDRKDYSVECVRFGAPTKLYKKTWKFLTREQVIQKAMQLIDNVLTLKVTVYGYVRENDKLVLRSKEFAGVGDPVNQAAFWTAHGPLTEKELRGWIPVYADSYIRESIASQPNRKVVNRLVGYYETWHLTNPLEIARLIRHRYPRWPLASIYRIITGEELK